MFLNVLDNEGRFDKESREKIQGTDVISFRMCSIFGLGFQENDCVGNVNNKGKSHYVKWCTRLEYRHSKQKWALNE
jgi:hypothetical protein